MVNKRGQLTIFIIVGILIVVGIVLFFFLKTEIGQDIIGIRETNPNAFLASCMEGKVKEAVYLISEQGGYIENPLNRSFKFEGEDSYKDISYLCFNRNYYYPCINQEPMLMSHLKNEIKKYIFNDVKDCFEDLRPNLEKEYEVISANYEGFEVELKPKKIIVNIGGELALKKAGESFILQDFELVEESRFYEIVIVVQEILSQNARFCAFSHLGHTAFHPEFEISKFKTGDSTIFYTITYKETGERFRFAIRGCVIPPAF